MAVQVPACNSVAGDHTREGREISGIRSRMLPQLAADFASREPRAAERKVDGAVNVAVNLDLWCRRG